MPYSTWWITRTMVIFLLSRNITVYAAVVAEWLRRLTRNQIPSGSAGSNPADCDTIFILPFLLLADMLPYFV